MVLGTVANQCAYFYSTYLTPVISSVTVPSSAVTTVNTILNITGVVRP